MSLPPKQQRFVEEYLADLNASRAAAAAGYSARSAGQTGWRLLALPRVKAAVDEGRKRLAERTEITLDRVMAEYARIGFADIRKAVRWRDGEGAVVTASDELDDATAAAVAEVSQTEKGALRVKLHDKKGALDSMARLLGGFAEKHEPADKQLGKPPDARSLAERLAQLPRERRDAIRAALKAAVEGG